MKANRVAGLGAEPSRMHETGTGIGSKYFGKSADVILPGQEAPASEAAGDAAATEVTVHEFARFQFMIDVIACHQPIYANDTAFA